MTPLQNQRTWAWEQGGASAVPRVVEVACAGRPGAWPVLWRGFTSAFLGWAWDTETGPAS